MNTLVEILLHNGKYVAVITGKKLTEVLQKVMDIQGRIKIKYHESTQMAGTYENMFELLNEHAQEDISSENILCSSESELPFQNNTCCETDIKRSETKKHLVTYVELPTTEFERFNGMFSLHKSNSFWDLRRASQIENIPKYVHISHRFFNEWELRNTLLSSTKNFNPIYIQRASLFGYEVADEVRGTTNNLCGNNNSAYNKQKQYKEAFEESTTGNVRKAIDNKTGVIYNRAVNTMERKQFVEIGDETNDCKLLSLQHVCKEGKSEILEKTFKEITNKIDNEKYVNELYDTVLSTRTKVSDNNINCNYSVQNVVERTLFEDKTDKNKLEEVSGIIDVHSHTADEESHESVGKRNEEKFQGLKQEYRLNESHHNGKQIEQLDLSNNLEMYQNNSKLANEANNNTLNKVVGNEILKKHASDTEIFSEIINQVNNDAIEQQMYEEIDDVKMSFEDKILRNEKNVEVWNEKANCSSDMYEQDIFKKSIPENNERNKTFNMTKNMFTKSKEFVFDDIIFQLLLEKCFLRKFGSSEQNFYDSKYKINPRINKSVFDDYSDNFKQQLLQRFWKYLSNECGYNSVYFKYLSEFGIGKTMRGRYIPTQKQLKVSSFSKREKIQYEERAGDVMTPNDKLKQRDVDFISSNVGRDVENKKIVHDDTTYKGKLNKKNIVSHSPDITGVKAQKKEGLDNVETVTKYVEKEKVELHSSIAAREVSYEIKKQSNTPAIKSKIFNNESMKNANSPKSSKDFDKNNKECESKRFQNHNFKIPDTFQNHTGQLYDYMPEEQRRINMSAKEFYHLEREMTRQLIREGSKNYTTAEVLKPMNLSLYDY